MDCQKEQQKTVIRKMAAQVAQLSMFNQTDPDNYGKNQKKFLSGLIIGLLLAFSQPNTEKKQAKPGEKGKIKRKKSKLIIKSQLNEL